MNGPALPPPLPLSSLDAERTLRKAHLSHESSVKSIGVLYCIGAVVLLAAGIMTFSSDSPRPFAVKITWSAILVVLAVLQFWTGIGVRRLQRWARTPAGILSGIGLLGFPIGTLINIYALYLVFSKKGAMVFSDQYRSVIAVTPDIKYKTSLIVWVFLGLLVTVLAFIALSALFSR